MPGKPTKLHPEIRKALGASSDTSDAQLMALWKRRTRRVCKPCWELKYCPYGPLVEDFPLPPSTIAEIQSHNEYPRSCLVSGKLGSGEKLDPWRRKLFKQELLTNTRRDLPRELPSLFDDISCRVFGHICPVFFTAEPVTETIDRRKSGRSVPRDVMLKVVRRDGQICQKCNEPVRDDEVEFDHVIPFSKGGTSSAENLRLVHKDCNRRKSDSLEEILAPNPLVHFYELQKNSSARRGKRTGGS